MTARKQDLYINENLIGALSPERTKLQLKFLNNLLDEFELTEPEKVELEDMIDLFSSIIENFDLEV